MTGPREWRHAEGCASFCPPLGSSCWDHKNHRCDCGLGVARDAVDQGHRVVVGAEGLEGRLEWRGCCDDPECVRNDERHVIPLEPS